MNYLQLMDEMKRGWNTWNSRSVLSHVLMPYGFAINLGIKNYQTGRVTRESLIGRFDPQEEQIHPGPRSYDGSYTALNWKQGELELQIESTAQNGEQYILVTPLSTQIKDPALIIEAAVLWNKEGTVCREGTVLRGNLPGKQVEVLTDGDVIRELNTGCVGPFVTVRLNRPVAVTTGGPVSAEELRVLLDLAREKVLQNGKQYGTESELYLGMSTCMAWDTIYEPEKDIVCSPVSRLWNIGWGGYVLFCWDTYFAAMLSMPDNKNLAYANVVAITREATENGFVPNFGAANNDKSRDRSQPPVGAHALLHIYNIYKEKWILEELYQELLLWNRWWVKNRMTKDNVLCWGSNPFAHVNGKGWEFEGVNDRLGAALESGLDNSPMYDDVPFDQETHMLCLADVGLTGLYIMDCEALAEISKVLGKQTQEAELRERAEGMKAGLEGLWDEETGIYQNKRTDTGEFYRRLSPTNFYALYSDQVSEAHKTRMMQEHFYNPQEFWGEFIMPTIARNDPAYHDQDYWRGRIWAPTNYLAYAAMRKAGLTKECSDLAEKSAALFLQEWLAHGHVHENYDGDNGWGCGVRNSDKFYHWGALLSLIALMDKGHI